MDPSSLALIRAVYLLGALSPGAFGDSDLIVNLLAGGGLGAIVGQLVILRRTHRGIRGRSAEIVAAWTALGAVFTLVGYALSEVL